MTQKGKSNIKITLLTYMPAGEGTQNYEIPCSDAVANIIADACNM